MRLIFRHMFNYLHENSMLTLHSGSVPATPRLLYTIFCQALGASTIVCEISKGFDRV